MKNFIEKHQNKIQGVISCFDRIIFKGHLPLNRPNVMSALLHQHSCLTKDFDKFVRPYSQDLINSAKKMATENNRPFKNFHNKRFDKNKEAQKICSENKIKEGLVCVLGGVEGCTSFKIIKGEKAPLIVNAKRKCLCLYFFFMNPIFGLIHIRIQTWFPFTIQIYMNGHEYLARQLDKHKIGYKKIINAFISIDDCAKAQKYADDFFKLKWPQILRKMADEVNPLLKTILRGMEYYWIVEQSEYATDVMFKSRSRLTPLFKCLSRHAIDCFSPENIMTFLGRKLNGLFAGEIVGEFRKRWPGVRVKHRMKENWIKIYDKHCSILRVETVINRPYEFYVRRGGRDGIIKWRPMTKGIANMFRYAEVSLSANKRYLDALAVVDDIETPRKSIIKTGQTVRINGKGFRGFNPLKKEDMALIAAVLRGEFFIHGFRNKDIRNKIFQKPTDEKQKRRQSSRMSRLLKRLNVHGLIAKIPHSRIWKVSRKGHKILTTFMKIHQYEYPNLLLQFNT